MNVQITNSSKVPVRRGGVVFNPGKTTKKQSELTAAQLAQIKADAALSVNYTTSSKGDK